MEAGSYLLSHTLAGAVPSAQQGLTSVFGMGTGVTLALSPPAKRSAPVHAKARPGAIRMQGNGGRRSSWIPRVKSNGQLVQVGTRLAALTPPAYQPGGLPGPFRESLS